MSIAHSNSLRSSSSGPLSSWHAPTSGESLTLELRGLVPACLGGVLAPEPVE